MNCTLELESKGVLAEFGVTIDRCHCRFSINKAEERHRFDMAMKKNRPGHCARSGIAHTLEEALAVAAVVGFPCITSPSFTMDSTDGSIAYNREES